MKFPRIPVALLLIAGLAWPVVAPSTSGTSAGKSGAKSAKAPAKAKKGAKLSKKDSLRLAQSNKMGALQLRLDSLKTIDSLHRVDSARVADSLRGVEAALLADSLRRVDSLRRADSLDRISRTWYLAKPRDLGSHPELTRSLFEKLRLQLLRTGRILMPLEIGRDTNSSYEASWNASLASKAGRFLYSTVQRATDSGWILSTWLQEIPSGRAVDSSIVSVAGSSPRDLDALASRTVRHLSPSATEARCDIDSLTQAATTWALEIPVNHTTDSTLNDRLRAAFANRFASTGRAKTVLLDGKTYCPTRKCTDSLARSANAQRALQFDIFRLPDSSWKATLVASDAATDSLLDSLLVTAPDLESLAAKSASLLVAPPATCRSLCKRTDPSRIRRKADDLTLDDIAKKHKVSLKSIESQIEKGIKVELEHTKSKSIAREIAKDHIFEIPDYYDRLDTMEKGAEKESEKKKK